MEENNELNIETQAEGPSNLTICPNCLEPNNDDLAVCPYCGMPLHPGAEGDPSAMPETEAELAANRAQAVPEEKKDTKKKQESGFQRVMPWLGLYLIYYAITGCFDVKRQVAQAAEAGQPVNEALAYVSQGIWFLAGVLMARPLIKKGWRKLRGLPEEEETPAEPENITEDSTEAWKQAEEAEKNRWEPADEIIEGQTAEAGAERLGAWEEIGQEAVTAPLSEDIAEAAEETVSEVTERAEPEDRSDADPTPEGNTDDSEFEEDDEAARWL